LDVRITPPYHSRTSVLKIVAKIEPEACLRMPFLGYA
jgi:hypothetical protein